MKARQLLLAIAGSGALAAAFMLGRHTRPDASLPPARTVVGAIHAAAPVQPAATAASVPQPAPSGIPLQATHDSSADDATAADTDAAVLPDIAAIDSYEDLLYAQPDMVDDAITRLRSSAAGTPALFAVGFAGDAEENVFRNEVAYLPKLLATRFAAEGRTLQLINSPFTFERTPLATRSNLEQALATISKRMNPDNDILLLFLTSHGSHDHRLLVEMGSMPLDQLTPQDIRDALDRAHVRWRVIVISACYSGGFIPALREPHTMIITAARADRTSFGCGSDSQLTWFGKAFLVDGLNRSTDFRAAFATAKTDVAQWERREHETPSEPQLWAGPLIDAKLDAWRASLPPSAPVVPFTAMPQRLERRSPP